MASQIETASDSHFRFTNSVSHNSSRARNPRGGRRGRGNRGGRGITASSQSRTTTGAPLATESQTISQVPQASKVQELGKEQNQQEDGVEADICFICASDVTHQCLTPCNHRTCHICGLRMRALYKNRDCAHCRVSFAFPQKAYILIKERQKQSMSYLRTTQSSGLRIFKIVTLSVRMTH
jgi:hypothetical protein